MTTTATRKPPVTIVQGYIIRTRKHGTPWYGSMDSLTCYAVKGQLPGEWDAVKSDPTIVEACIYRTTQAVKRADKRINVDSFTR